jgi:hypothetical protein
MLGALGYWWLLLAEPVLARRLWLGPGAAVPPRTVWESSLSGAVAHVVGPLLSPGAALGALLWGVGAMLLPWIVRGSRAAMDVAAAAVWATALTIAAPALDAGLSAGAHPLPRGAVLGAVVGGLAAVGARGAVISRLPPWRGCIGRRCTPAGRECPLTRVAWASGPVSPRPAPCCR